jgi:hypothetical protein
MCLLIVKPAGVSIPKQELIHASFANPHGAGIAWSDGKKTRIAKNAKWDGYDIVQALEPLHDKPALIHFRYATHGSQNDANAHPFSLPAGYVAAHNGIIHGIKCGEDESDTRAFLRQYVAPTLQLWGKFPKGSIENLATLHGPGNKIAFLAPSGDYSITNEGAGFWDNGAWFSNANHRCISSYDEMDGEKPEIIDVRDTNSLRCDYCGSLLAGEFNVLDDASFCCLDCQGYTFPDDRGLSL